MVIDAVVLGRRAFLGRAMAPTAGVPSGKSDAMDGDIARRIEFRAILLVPEQVKARWAFYSETLFPSSYKLQS